MVDGPTICFGGSNLVGYPTTRGTPCSAGTIPVPAGMRSMTIEKYHQGAAGTGGDVTRAWGAAFVGRIGPR